MKNILLLMDTLFGATIGSTEKLLVDFMEFLSDTGEYTVFGVYNQRDGAVIPERIANRPGVFLRSFASFGPGVPAGHLTLEVDLGRMLEECRPDAVILVVGEPYNPYVMSLPPEIPLFLVSAFGEYVSNGNVRKLYVSGQKNTAGLWNSGVRIAEQFHNPLWIPPFDDAKAGIGPGARDRSARVTFGRSGRGDDAIFDPISIDAFARLERTYGDLVRYVYVNPPPRAVAYTEAKGVRGIEFRGWLSEEELRAFYNSIDVFAHARSDGETLGVAVAEALLAQNPVITHVSAFNNEHHAFLKEPYGRIASFGSVDEYHDAMAFFVENRDRLGAFGTAARENVLPLFDRRRIATKFLADVAEVCGYYGRPRDALDIF